MTTATAPARLSRAAIPARTALAAALLALPFAWFLWLLAYPSQNPELYGAIEHFAITTNVSVLALGVAALLSRAALQLGQYRILLSALGFVCLAGFFLSHAAFTPGVLVRGANEEAASVVIGVSAQLSLFFAAVCFAVRYSSLAGWLERHVRPLALTALVVAGVAVYFALAAVETRPLADLFAGFLPREAPLVYVERGRVVTAQKPVSYAGSAVVPLIAGAITIALLAGAAWGQARDFLRSRLPTDGALVASYVMLAEAQAAMSFGPIGTLAWWEYHGLMLLALLVAVGALFLELDRRRGLERFLPATVVERVLAGDALRLGGERKMVTILFADLRGSTALADRMPPEDIVRVVNAYLGAMARSVFLAGGILDKFLGDGLMAIFGALSDPTDGASAAARAALEMRRLIGELNTQRAAAGEPQIRFGIGIHTGEVVLGAIGLPERSDYTALGDTVNTASRLESLTKEYGVDCVVSADAAERIARDGFALRELGSTALRGKAQPLVVSTLA